MKLATALLIGISFLGVAVFGFAVVSQCQGGMGCIASFVQGLFCPIGSGIFNRTLSHADAFHGFSLAIVERVSAIMLVWTALFFLLGGLKTIFLNNRLGFFARFYHNIENSCHFGTQLRSSLIDWLQIHQKRDPATCL